MANTLIKNTAAPGTGGGGGGGAGGGGGGSGGSGGVPPPGSACRAALDAVISNMFPDGRAYASAGNGSSGGNGITVQAPNGAGWSIDSVRCLNGYVEFDYKDIGIPAGPRSD